MCLSRYCDTAGAAEALPGVSRGGVPSHSIMLCLALLSCLLHVGYALCHSDDEFTLR